MASCSRYSGTSSASITEEGRFESHQYPDHPLTYKSSASCSPSEPVFPNGKMRSTFLPMLELLPSLSKVLPQVWCSWKIHMQNPPHSFLFQCGNLSYTHFFLPPPNLKFNKTHNCIYKAYRPDLLFCEFWYSRMWFLNHIHLWWCVTPWYNFYLSIVCVDTMSFI